MTFGEKLFDALAIERARLGGTLPRERWLAVANETAQSEGVLRKRKPKGAERARNPLFDALALTMSTIQSLDELTRLAAKAVGIALADIKEACPDVTVEEIQRRAALYKRRWPDPRNWSAPALAKHWPEFGNGGRPTRTGVEFAPEPAEWRAAARKIAEATAATNLRETRIEAADGWEWCQIGPEFRRLIFEELNR